MRHQEIARELRRIAPNCADVPRAALDRAHALPADGRGDDRRRRAAAARVAVPQHAVVAAAPRVQRAVGGEGDRVRPPARDGGDGDAHQAAHPLRDAAGLAVGRQAGTEVAVAVAELAVLVAAPAPHLPLGGEREHVRAAARQRVDRVAQQPLDEPRLEHRAALAGAERAVLALPPREDAAVGVERERRARAAHHRAQVGAAEVRHDLRVDAREVVADAELPVRVRAPAEHVGLELRRVGGARRAELRRVRADRRRQRERLAARRGRRGALGTWHAVFGIASLLDVLAQHLGASKLRRALDGEHGLSVRYPRVVSGLRKREERGRRRYVGRRREVVGDLRREASQLEERDRSDSSLCTNSQRGGSLTPP